jgi:S-adenosylmethionine:tRNA ribosyltransferase-isomerase
MMTMTEAPGSLRAPVASSRPRVLRPASGPRDDREAERLIHLDPLTGAFRDLRVGELPTLLCAGDVVIVNDAATMPASLRARWNARDLELRLLAHEGGSRFRAALFGEGDWHVDTDVRVAPPCLAVDAVLDLGGLRARVVSVSSRSARDVVIELDRQDDRLWSALYALGRPIQYSHVPHALPLWAVQTSYAARPWAMEMPSAGRPLSWNLIHALVARGVTVRALTHAAGISATGDPAIDHALPLPERYDIPERTVVAITEARGRGGRVIAIGTSVTRALEGATAQNGGVLRAGIGITDLRLGAHTRRRVVDGLLTGMHDDDRTSHFALLRAFAEENVLERAFDHAAAVGYLGHEFGDSMLILPRSSREDGARASR